MNFEEYVCACVTRYFEGVWQSFSTPSSLSRLWRGTRQTLVTPLRDTVSASEHLLPLSYIAGAIQGSPDIRVNARKGVSQRKVSAKEEP